MNNYVSDNRKVWKEVGKVKGRKVKFLIRVKGRTGKGWCVRDLEGVFWGSVLYGYRWEGYSIYGWC